MTTWELTLPITGKPSDVLLTANMRCHWRVRSSRTKMWRQLAHLSARNAIQRGVFPRLQWAQVDVWFALPSGRRRDVGNLYPTVKAVMDGLVDAGLLPDDDDTHLSGPHMHRLTGDAGLARMVLVVSDVPVMAVAPGLVAVR